MRLKKTFTIFFFQGTIRKWEEEKGDSRKGKGKNRAWKRRINGTLETNWGTNNESSERWGLAGPGFLVSDDNV